MKLGQKYSALRARRTVLSAALMATVAIGPMVVAPAAYAQAASERSFNIQPQSLADALVAFASQSGYQVTTNGAEIRGVRTNGVKATLPSVQALGQILAGTGFTYRINGNVVTIERAPESADGSAVQLGPVRVEGRTYGSGGSGGNGLGSSDVTATENSGSYTTRAMSVATKMPTTLRETPRSVSVITQQQLRDQGLEGKNLEDVLRYTPGVTMDDTLGNFMGNGGVPMIGIYVRGEQVKSFQIDGVNFDTTGRTSIDRQGGNGYAGTTWTFTDGMMSLPDMSVFDHVEVVRGPNAMFAGNGSVAATVTLVRKRPLNHAQTLVDTTYGSWDIGDRDYYRFTLDTTGPLALDGRLRGRFLVTQRNGAGNFQKRYQSENLTLFGSLELDVTPTTLLGGGFSRETRDETGLPGSQGLPRYHWGSDIGLPINTNLANPNAFKDDRVNTAWGYIEQQLGGDWLFKLNANYSAQKVRYWNSRITSSNIYEDNSGLRVSASNYDSGEPRYTKSLNMDANVTGTFSLFGGQHQLMLGVDHKRTRGRSDYTWQKTNASSITITIPDIFDFDSQLGAFPNLQLEQNPAGDVHYYRREETGIYGTLKLELLNNLHLLTSARLAYYSLRGNSIKLNDPTYNKESLDASYSIPISPSMALTWDFARNWTAFVSYAESYVDQSYLLKGERATCGGTGEPTCASVSTIMSIPGYYASGPGERMDPETGYNLEAGIKGELFDGRLNTSASLFASRRENFASIWFGAYDWNYDQGSWFFPAPWMQELSKTGQICCYAGDGNYQKSRGAELEVSGELFAGFHVSGGYTYQDVKRVEPLAEQMTTNLHSRSPKHLFKLWTSYQPQGGALRDFRFGLGVTGQSRTYSSGQASEYLGTDPNYVWLDSDGNPTGQTGRDVYSNMSDYANCGDPNGTGTCFNSGGTYSLPFDFSQGAYAVVNAMVDYRISDQFAIQLNVDNVFNKKYYRTIGTATEGNYYGAPRFISVALRGRF